MKAAADATRIGELVGGKYRIVRLLARGGMGVVYEAHHAVVRRRFAIKFLRRDLAERRDILNRFQREAEAAGALENDNVTAAVDFGISDDGAPFIVMEYLVGESLADLLEREGRLPVQRAADLVAQACRGVEAAHLAGIVHRDLKPHNLFVARRDDGTDLLKVLDFGVAKLQALDEATAATGTGTILGRRRTCRPSRPAATRPSTSAPTSTRWARSSTSSCPRNPHPGELANAILHHIATQPAVPLDSLRPTCPADLVAIVGRALTSDPAARPASAGRWRGSCRRSRAARSGRRRPRRPGRTWPRSRRRRSRRPGRGPGCGTRCGEQELPNPTIAAAPRRLRPGGRPWVLASRWAAPSLVAAAIAVGIGLKPQSPAAAIGDAPGEPAR